MKQRSTAKYLSIYEVNTRVWLTELSQHLGGKVTLDDIPDTSLDEFVQLGFDWIWFLSVWSPGAEARKISRKNIAWRQRVDVGSDELLPTRWTVLPSAAVPEHGHGTMEIA